MLVFFFDCSCINCSRQLIRAIVVTLLITAGSVPHYALPFSCQMRRFDCCASNYCISTIAIAARQSFVGYAIDALAELHGILLGNPVTSAHGQPTREQRRIHIAPAL